MRSLYIGKNRLCRPCQRRLRLALLQILYRFPSAYHQFYVFLCFAQKTPFRWKSSIRSWKMRNCSCLISSAKLFHIAASFRFFGKNGISSGSIKDSRSFSVSLFRISKPSARTVVINQWSKLWESTNDRFFATAASQTTSSRCFRACA
jgi:hypothetical protein